jgi:hypothetical protein
MLLDERDMTRAVGTDESVQRLLRRDYQDSLEPFTAPYRQVKETTFQRPVKPEMLDIPASRPAETVSKAPVMATGQVLAELGNLADTVAENRTVRAVANRITADPAPTVGRMMARISDLQARAAKAYRTGDAAAGRAFSRLANAMQEDLDTSIASGVVRELDALYQQAVIRPYGEIRRSFGRDPSVTWRHFSRLTPETKRRLANSVSPQTRDAIRRRVVAQIIELEERTTGATTGTGAPAFRELDRRGFSAFFTPKEWRGLRAITAHATWLKGLLGRGLIMGAGYQLGGPVGVVGGLVADQLLLTVPGRSLVEQAFGMSPRHLRDALSVVVANPGQLQGAAQAARPEHAQ